MTMISLALDHHGSTVSMQGGTADGPEVTTGGEEVSRP